MAVRLNKRHSDVVRTKIQTSQLINRLENHAFGEVELSPTQLRAIEILLNKSIPNLAAVAVQSLDSAEEQLKQITVKLVGENTRDTSGLPEPLPAEPLQSVLGRQRSSEILELRYRSTDPSDSETVTDSMHKGGAG